MNRRVAGFTTRLFFSFYELLHGECFIFPTSGSSAAKYSRDNPIPFPDARIGTMPVPRYFAAGSMERSRTSSISSMASISSMPFLLSQRYLLHCGTQSASRALFSCGVSSSRPPISTQRSKAEPERRFNTVSRIR